MPFEAITLILKINVAISVYSLMLILMSLFKIFELSEIVGNKASVL